MATYKIDPAHSEILFKVRHLMISYVTGSFQKFDATMESDAPDFTDAKISFEADIDSIDTNSAQRDGHLKSDDFFNAEKFPKLTFVSTGITKETDEEYKLEGDLTIRDITKRITLNVVYNGTMVDPWSQTKIGFEVTGKINRKEFGLKWHAATETGGIVAGDEVKLVLNVQMLKTVQQVVAA
ncbi:MAG TPA: YceI family protein [Chitinophagaceae bacterium]|nr:YceI family protein [Chitinophagaceae bacterium]